MKTLIPLGVLEIRAQRDDEAGSPKVLIQKLRVLIPELLELNLASATEARVSMFYQREDRGVLTF